jgi:uncharacterized membrane protein
MQGRAPLAAEGPLPQPPVNHILIHFYRAVVSHMDVWRQRMDATTNWAAATMAGMITFAFGTLTSPHFVLLLAIAFTTVFLIMESRRYQMFDLWRRRFRTLNHYFIAPALEASADLPAEEQARHLEDLAEDLGRTVPVLRLRDAVGYRIRRNYGYLLLVGYVAWSLKLEVHPTTAGGWSEIFDRATVGSLHGVVVVAIMLVYAVIAAGLALRAPSEQMQRWKEVAPPIRRFWLFRRADDEPDTLPITDRG